MGSDNTEREGDKRKQLALSFSRKHPQTHHHPTGTKAATGEDTSEVLLRMAQGRISSRKETAKGSLK